MDGSVVARALWGMAGRAYPTESDLQRRAAAVLEAAGLAVERERDLGDAGRIDLYVELPTGRRVGVECKTKGGVAALVRQAWRYCSSGELDELVILTTRRSHRPAEGALADAAVPVAFVVAGVL